MFSALRPNNLFYILDKSNDPSLKIGQVLSVTSPLYYGINATVDVTVKADEQTLEFKQLPANLNIANHIPTGLVVSESKDAMINEIEGLLKTSKSILDSVPYHEKILKNGDQMLRSLNPQYDKEKSREEKIDVLECKVGSVESALGEIKEMLNKALNKQ